MSPKWKAVYQSILCRSIVSSPDPTLSRVNSLDFSMRICFVIISLASVELKSRLLTWHYLLKTLNGHQTLFLGREWGLGMRLYVASTGVAWSELVNKRCHFWMVRQGTAWFHYVAIIYLSSWQSQLTSCRPYHWSVGLLLCLTITDPL